MTQALFELIYAAIFGIQAYGFFTILLLSLKHQRQALYILCNIGGLMCVILSYRALTGMFTPDPLAAALLAIYSGTWILCLRRLPNLEESMRQAAIDQKYRGTLWQRFQRFVREAEAQVARSL